MSRCARVRLAAALLLPALVAPVSLPRPAAPAGAAAAATPQPAAELLRDLHDLPWRLQPGVYALAADVTVAPDGTIWVLDRRQQALHRLTVLGDARAVTRVPAELLGEGFEPRRIDAGPDGTYLLAISLNAARVLRIDAAVGVRVVAELPQRYTDVAALPGGGFLLSRAQGQPGPSPSPRDPRPQSLGGVDRFAADGSMIGSLPEEPLAQALGVDVAVDGRVFVINRIPVPDAPQATEPPATQVPSGRRAGRSQAGIVPQNGVVRYDAAGHYLDTVPFLGLEDVAAGPEATYVARQAEVYRLGEDLPLWTGPTARVQVPSAGATVLRLAQPWRGGRLLASLNHCHAQGLLAWDLARPDAPPGLRGGLDHPPLAGPLVPLRLAAGATGPLLLQGRSWLRGGPFGDDLMTGQAADRPQTVQRWTWQGDLRDQVGVCGGLDLPWYADLSDAGWTVDLAADGERLYLLQRGAVEARDGPGFPSWTWRPEPVLDDSAPTGRFTAIAAAEGRIAVVDAGTGRLRRLDPDGAEQGAWSWPADLGAPVDLAWDGTELLMAHAAPPALLRLGPAGDLLDRLPLPDIPRALAADDSGKVWILGSGGRLWQFARDGTLLAALASPAGPNAVDLAAGPDGSLWLAHVRLGPGDGAGSAVLAAGLLALRPTAESAPGAVLADSECWAWVAKGAWPRTLLLGGTAEVRLRQAGYCRPRVAVRRRLLLVDGSRSMAWESSLERVRGAVLALLDGLPHEAGPLGLYAFTDALRLLAPEGRPSQELRAALMQLEPGGDTRLGAALAALATGLAGDPGRPDEGTDVIVFTDGELKDDLRPGLEALRALPGLRLRLVLAPRSSFDPATTVNLRRILGELGTVEELPLPQGRPAWVDALLDARAPAHWAREAVVEDLLPANMRLLSGSLDPPGQADEVAGLARWTLPPQAQGQESLLRLTLRPQERGLWPTNAAAGLSFVDGWGERRALAYPIPWVKVLDRADLSGRAFLPAVGGRFCPRVDGVDLVLVLDASESMGTPDGPGGRRRIDVAGEAGALLVGGALDAALDRAALVTFHRTATLAAPLGTDPAGLAAALAAIRLAPGTRVDAGLAMARKALAAGRPGVRRALILISDGRQSAEPATALAEAAALRSAGVRILSVGLGEDADAAFLRDLAGGDDGYVPALRIGELPMVLGLAGERLLCRR